MASKGKVYQALAFSCQGLAAPLLGDFCWQECQWTLATAGPFILMTFRVTTFALLGMLPLLGPWKLQLLSMFPATARRRTDIFRRAQTLCEAREVGVKSLVFCSCRF